MLSSTKNKLIGKTVSVEGTITGSLSNPIDYLLNSNARFEISNATLHYNDSIQRLSSLNVVTKNELPNFHINNQKIIFNGTFSEDWGKYSITDVEKIKFINNPTDLIEPNVDLFIEFNKNKLILDKQMFDAIKNRQNNNSSSVRNFSFENLLNDIFNILTRKQNVTKNVTSSLIDLLSLMSLDIRDIDLFETFTSATFKLSELELKKLSNIRGLNSIYTDNSKLLIDSLNKLNLKELNLPNLNILKQSMSQLLDEATRFNDINKLSAKQTDIIDFVSKTTSNDIDLLNDILNLIQKSK